MATATGTYSVEGQLLEVCSCGTLCPCWVGEDPDGGTCDSFLAYHVEQGQIKGVDVSGLTLVNIVHIPGNILAGNWRAVRYLDAKGTQEQRDAMFDLFSGKLGGPLADLAALVGEELDVRVAPIEYSLLEGHGRIEIDGVLRAEMEPFKGPDGQTTKLVDSIFSTIPGSPAYVAKASANRVDLPEFNLTWEYTGRNAIQGKFRFEG
jgi:hypothetical protein